MGMNSRAAFLGGRINPVKEAAFLLSVINLLSLLVTDGFESQGLRQSLRLSALASARPAQQYQKECIHDLCSFRTSRQCLAQNTLAQELVVVAHLQLSFELTHRV